MTTWEGGKVDTRKLQCSGQAPLNEKRGVVWRRETRSNGWRRVVLSAAAGNKKELPP